MSSSVTFSGVVLLWIGPWKPWFRLTLISFARNNDVTLHVVSPNDNPGGEFRNVVFHRMGVAEIEKRMSVLLGSSIKLSRPYKLCDFKPLYGRLFPEILSGHCYWGWCDEDVIWGNLDAFIPRRVLDEWDVVATCRPSVSGQLCLLRYSEATLDLFRRIPGWREKLLDQNTNYTLDEIPFNTACLELESEGAIRVLRRQFQTHDINSGEWNAWADQLEIASSGRPFGTFRHGAACWREGHVFNEESGEEFAFFHFGHWKRSWNIPPISSPPDALNHWRFTAEGIAFSGDLPLDIVSNRYLRAYRVARIRARGEVLIQNLLILVRRVARHLNRRLSLLLGISTTR